MTAADLSPVSAIEQASFLTPWAEKDFIKALAQNQELCAGSQNGLKNPIHQGLSRM